MRDFVLYYVFENIKLAIAFIMIKEQIVSKNDFKMFTSSFFTTL